MDGSSLNRDADSWKGSKVKQQYLTPGYKELGGHGFDGASGPLQRIGEPTMVRPPTPASAAHDQVTGTEWKEGGGGATVLIERK